MQLNPGVKVEHFSGSYAPDDVQILLKPAKIAPTPVAEKEALIQSGARHYSEMLSAEAVPDERYMQLYDWALKRNAGRLKSHIETLACGIAARPQTSRSCVIVSLARAGTPIGVLLTRQLRRAGVYTNHYSISIIRGRGIDLNAMSYILERHTAAEIVFVDGWTGKGAITRELVASLADSDMDVEPFLVVVADPAGCASLAATTDDYVIPSGLLNGIISGLISRSVLNKVVVRQGEFHACLFMEEHAPHDLSTAYLDAIEAAEPEEQGSSWSEKQADASHSACQHLLACIMTSDGIDDMNRIKPGIAEATRAILRRVPDKVYLKDLNDPEVMHMIYLAEASGVPVEQRDLGNYRAVTIIKKLGGEQE